MIEMSTDSWQWVKLVTMLVGFIIAMWRTSVRLEKRLTSLEKDIEHLRGNK